MPKRRFLLILAASVLLVGPVLLVMRRTAQNNSWLPHWIAAVKPKRSDRIYLPYPKAAERLSEAETRSVPISFVDFGLRMDEFVKQETGWNVYPRTGDPQGWVHETPTDTKTIAVIPNGEVVTVYSTRIHHLNWLEKAHHTVRGYFGAKN
jgi:hypothetical protein